MVSDGGCDTERFETLKREGRVGNVLSMWNDVTAGGKGSGQVCLSKLRGLDRQAQSG